MARTFKRKQSLDALTELNVTPLLDLAFSLLIIFMITTPLLEQTIPINLPEQDKSSSLSRPDVKFQAISVDGSGAIFWGKQKVDLVELNSLLVSLAAQPDPPAISLRADASLKYQIVIDVIDAIKRNNLTKLHLDTRVK